MFLTRREAVNIIGLGALSAIGARPLLSEVRQPEQNSASNRTVGSVFPSGTSVVSIPRSPVLKGIRWLSVEQPYAETDKRGDTFPVTWASDDNLYTSAGDPVWPDKGSGLDVECLTGMAPYYRVERINPMTGYSGWGGCGPKPTGFISVDGALYLAFQNMTGTSQLPSNPLDIMMIYGHGYDAQIVQSRDFGKTWQPDLKTIGAPMFPGRTFAAPAFINYGRDNEGARDNFVYAISGEGWDNGSHLRLGRVPRADIMSVDKWEWVAGWEQDSSPVWNKRLSDSIAVLTHPGYLGYVDMVYLRKLRRYLVLSWHHKVKCNPDAGSELIVYDAPEPWGPFTLVHHEDPWESAELNPYNPRLPLKWFDQDKLEGWILFSGSWRSGGKTPTYRTHVRRLRLLTINAG
jgi:hypothetical protein